MSGARRARWLIEDAEGAYGIGEASEDVEAAFMSLQDIGACQRVVIACCADISTDKKGQRQVKR